MKIIRKITIQKHIIVKNAKRNQQNSEKCGKNTGTEVHHLQHQAEADKSGVIKNGDAVFHKNNLANLMTLCDTCHDEEHKVSKKGSKRVKTTKGNKINNI